MGLISLLLFLWMVGILTITFLILRLREYLDTRGDLPANLYKEFDGRWVMEYHIAHNALTTFLTADPQRMYCAECDIYYGHWGGDTRGHPKGGDEIQEALDELRQQQEWSSDRELYEALQKKFFIKKLESYRTSMRRGNATRTA